MKFSISRRFEILCREFPTDYLDNKGEKVKRTGKWWGNVEDEKAKFEQHEIAIIADTGRTLYLGECKWTDAKIGVNELNQLQESSKRLAGMRKPVKFVLFGKNGFALSERDDVLLFDAEDSAGEPAFQLT